MIFTENLFLKYLDNFPLNKLNFFCRRYLCFRVAGFAGKLSGRALFP